FRLLPGYSHDVKQTWAILGDLWYEFDRFHYQNLNYLSVRCWNTLRRGLVQYLPHLIVAVALVSILGASYASAVSSTSTSPKATWAVNPVTITFPATVGTGTKPDSFTCSPSASGIILIAKASTSKVSLSVAPSSFASCGSIPDVVTLTAHCLVPAAQCRGTYSGLVQIRQPANYRNIPANLGVTIVVT